MDTEFEYVVEFVRVFRGRKLGMDEGQEGEQLDHAFVEYIKAR